MLRPSLSRLLILFAVLLFLSASAVAEDTALSVDPDAGTVSLRWSKAVARQNYSLLVVEGTPDQYTVSSDTLVFADQLQSDSDGTLSLTFIGMELPGCVFLAGGNESSSPMILGSYVPSIPPNKTHLPAALTRIEDEAFAFAPLDYVYLSESVVSIGARAFMQCAPMRYIAIPSSVTEIADDAFSGCMQLTIGCAENSSAHLFAVANGIPYELTE